MSQRWRPFFAIMFGTWMRRCAAVAVLMLIVSASSSPLLERDDLDSAASDHDHLGRVQIKVYRGPSEHDFAPWGFWVKQPADDYH